MLTFPSPIGQITVFQEGEFITGIYMGAHNLPALSTCEKTPLLAMAQCQITEYFDKKRREFTLPLLLKGTEFQKKVWNALLSVEYGQTASYKDIAQMIGNPKGCRAVGMANNKNPISIVVP